MMDIRITPGLLEGTVTPPPSKSIAHRAILAAALTSETSTIQNITLSQDIEATLRCVSALGGAWKQEGDTLHVSGLWHREWDTAELPHLDCGESGSTLRFMIPIALTLNNGGVFTGRGRRMERPQKPYFDIFDEKGIFYRQKDGVLTITGELMPGEFRLPGNVSSQFVTGLLYALPLMEWESEIILTSKLESKGYVNMTLAVLKDFGVTAEHQFYNPFAKRAAPEGQWYERYIIPGDQVCRAKDITIEPDWSQAAFWMAAEFLGSDVEVEGMNYDSVQGDRAIDRQFVLLGRPEDYTFSASGFPDLVPPLALMAAVRSGTVRLTNAARLRIKESDRLATVAQTLNALGAQVEEGPDFLKITGRDGLEGGVTVDCCNDHRIAMMAAIAATRCKKPVTLVGAECVNKSYPTFWNEYKRLGGKMDVL